jgi:hypothetical protein
MRELHAGPREASSAGARRHVVTAAATFGLAHIHQHLMLSDMILFDSILLTR